MLKKYPSPKLQVYVIILELRKQKTAPSKATPILCMENQKVVILGNLIDAVN